MGERASTAIHDAIGHPDGSHVTLLLKALEDLRQRSSTDRLPKVVASIGKACTQLDAVLSSQRFQACVGDAYPKNLPRIADIGLGQPVQTEDVTVALDGKNLGTMPTLRTAAISDTPGVTTSLGPPTLSQANVKRLTVVPCGAKLRVHDRRGLRLTDGKLDIFEKGSKSKVKMSIDVRLDVQEFFIFNNSKRLSLTMRRLPQGADIDCGVWTTKNYLFEFLSTDECIAFHTEISRLCE